MSARVASGGATHSTGSPSAFSSDSFMSSSSVPAEAVRSFIAADRAIGVASLVTIQMQGYVAADESGLVDMSQPLATRLAARFKQVAELSGGKVPSRSEMSTAEANVLRAEADLALLPQTSRIGASPRIGIPLPHRACI